jgi:2'-5' RNA ligase
MEQVRASQYPEVYTDLGIDPNDLGCIMAATQPIAVSNVIDPSDLYYDPEDDNSQPLTSENEPHTTLLYGLLSSGPAMRKHVDAVLNGWSLPSVQIHSVEAWGQPDSDSKVIVAKLVPTDNLLEGHARLQLLPHLDTFSNYVPHITLAYVKSNDKTNGYVDELNRRLALSVVPVTGIDYGK